ncbi:hypothetical protein N072000002_13130 [Clostridium tetani]|uniref:AAA-ATPase-like domain-containing protein n=1 Tax=Clostridium tetani TaxID=1513 RepID=A0ABC8EBV0_CLOTA|nr:hypothetical protein K234311028_13790 [Clostridium tetani]BDR89512.1 hypothetical protein N072000002_13130 [Clostridium tetani]
MLANKINKQVFVIIDEYDNFANELITGGKQNTYESILHGEGFVKVFYKALKDATMDRFNIHTMYSVKENFKSPLFYLGMLTIKGQGLSVTVLKVPNYVIKTIYWEQYFQRINLEYNIQTKDVRDAITEMRVYGNIEALAEIIGKILEDLFNRDLMQMDEKHIKMMFLTLLGIDNTYFIQSEAENSKGYVDIMLKRKIQYKDITKFQWIIELKYIKESERKTLEKVKEEGLNQLKGYAESKIVKEQLGEEGLKKALIIVEGKKDIYTVQL